MALPIQPFRLLCSGASADGICMTSFMQYLYNKRCIKANILMENSRLLCTQPLGDNVNQRVLQNYPVGTGKKYRIKVKLTEDIMEAIQMKNIHPKDHSGSAKTAVVTLPRELRDAAKKILTGTGLKSLKKDAEELRRYLLARQQPLETEDYKKKVESMERKFIEQEAIVAPFLSSKQQSELESIRHQKMKRTLKSSIYHWEPINFDRYNGLKYLVTQTAAEFASLVFILNEIKVRDDLFNPRTVFDFGSGIGCSAWAINEVWPKSVSEFYFVDKSSAMNDLSELLFRQGNANNEPLFPIYYRNFFPKSYDRKYDIVVCSHSLMELPNLDDRLEKIDSLWKMTSNYLIIVEQGTNAGFMNIIEARDFVLMLDKKFRKPKGHAFSPCPHDQICPRFEGDKTPCNFKVAYRPLLPFDKNMSALEQFSYIVLKKGPRLKQSDLWPRVVRAPLKRNRHTICRVCTSAGNLSEILVSKSKYPCELNIMARRTKWGDRLPVTITNQDDPIDRA